MWKEVWESRQDKQLLVVLFSNVFLHSWMCFSKDALVTSRNNLEYDVEEGLGVQTRQTAGGWKCRNLEGAVPGFGKL